MLIFVIVYLFQQVYVALSYHRTQPMVMVVCAVVTKTQQGMGVIIRYQLDLSKLSVISIKV